MSNVTTAFAKVKKVVKKPATKPVEKEHTAADYDKHVDSLFDTSETETKVVHSEKAKSSTKPTKADKKPVKQDKSEVKLESKAESKLSEAELEKADLEFKKWLDISDMWGIVLNTEVSPEQAVQCMLAMKLCFTKHSEDIVEVPEMQALVDLQKRLAVKSKEMDEARQQMMLQFLATKGK